MGFTNRFVIRRSFCPYICLPVGSCFFCVLKPVSIGLVRAIFARLLLLNHSLFLFLCVSSDGGPSHLIQGSSSPFCFHRNYHLILYTPFGVVAVFFVIPDLCFLLVRT